MIQGLNFFIDFAVQSWLHDAHVKRISKPTFWTMQRTSGIEYINPDDIKSSVKEIILTRIYQIIFTKNDVETEPDQLLTKIILGQNDDIFSALTLAQEGPRSVAIRKTSIYEIAVDQLAKGLM